MALIRPVARGADLPPLNDPPTQSWIPGKFVWADLFTSDPGAAAPFYTGLLGWSEQTVVRTAADGTAHSLVILSNEGRPVAGIVDRPARPGDAARGRWIGFISVPDVAHALSSAVAGGAKVLFPPRDLPDRGTQSVFIDPEGAELGLLHSSSGDPEDYAPDVGDWTWAELFARDPGVEAQFYHAIGGYEIVPDLASSRTVSILASAGYSRGSIAPLPDRPKAHPAWLLFVRVGDVAAAAARVPTLGGRVLVPPSGNPSQYWKAIVADPTGAVIGLVQLRAAAPERGQP